MRITAKLGMLGALCALLPACVTISISRSPTERIRGNSIDGKLEIMKVGRSSHDPYNGVLLYDYGMMIWDDRFENDPTRYELFFQQSKEVFKTTDLKALKKELAKIPAESKLYLYDKCQVSARDGFSPTRMSEIEDRCKELGITLITGDEENAEFKGHIICTCN